MSYVKSPEELGLKTDTTGIYIMTEETWIDAMVSTGFLQFGLGDAPEGTIADRQFSLSSSKNVSWQKYLLDTIPEPGYRDHALHKIVRQSVAAQLPRPDSNRYSELFKIAVEKMLIEQFIKTKDFESIRIWLNAKIRKCAANLNPNHEKQKVNLRNVQILVIKKVLTALRQNGIVTNFVCELAARIGKTILFLSLAKNMQKEFGHESMFIMAYGVGLSVKTSYKDEISRYIDFAGMEFIDAADAGSKEQYKQAVANNKMPVVFVSLNPEAEEKYEWINQLTGTHVALLEETDFGTHTDSQVEKVEYILDGKTITRINASGTNIGRLAKAFGKNAIDEIISVPYCMVEQDPSIPNVVIRRFYNMLFNPKMNKLLEDFDKDVLPNINKILEKARSQEKFIAAVFQDLLGYQPIYGMNLSEAAGEIINHLMLFVNISKKAMEALTEIIEKYCTEHKVLILNGDYTDNKEAEGITKEELVRLQNGYYTGRDKLLVITNMMGTRSYSIPEIQACLFMQEGGDVYPYMQKYSRCLTPGYNKKFGHIFDFAFNQRKTRNSVMSVAVEAALLIRQEGKTYPEAVREVLNSVNIKDMISGNWMDADAIIKQFEDNNKLLEIANAHTRITIDDLTSEEIEAFGELAKRSSGSKAEKSKIDKIVETGKTFDSRKPDTGKVKKNPLKAIVEKAIRMINESATTVLALSNYHGESFLECVDIINDNVDMYEEFMELYGIGPDTIKRLSHRLEISTLDMIVRMSKYNTTQKHIENNSLAIIKDSPELWFEIFRNQRLKQFIKSRNCKSILVVAGGYGSEIDVLVDIFGIEIIDKIVYNDKYTFLCNQIKRKYPTITVIKKDFRKLEFNMKFDVVIGNPPYNWSDGDKQRKNNRENLWTRFVSKSFESWVEQNGYVAMVVPKTWMSPSRDYGKTTIVQDYFKPNQVEAINIDECARHFNVGSSFSYFIVKVDGSKSSQLTKVVSNSGKFDMDLKSNTWNMGIPTILEKDIISMLGKFYKNSKPFDWLRQYEGQINDISNHGPVAVFHTPASKGKTFSNTPSYLHTTVKVMVSLSGRYEPFYDNGNTSPSGFVVCLKIKEGETLKNAQSVLSSKLYTLVVDKLFRYNGFINGNVLKGLPALDLTCTWNDQDIYNYFQLTQDEINAVERNS
jgi:hypothetical protein